MKTDKEMENMKRRLKDRKIRLTQFIYISLEFQKKHGENGEEPIFKVIIAGNIIQQKDIYKYKKHCLPSSTKRRDSYVNT